MFVGIKMKAYCQYGLKWKLDAVIGINTLQILMLKEGISTLLIQLNIKCGFIFQLNMISTLLFVINVKKYIAKYYS